MKNKVNYYHTLSEVLQLTISQMADQDLKKYTLFMAMASFADSLGQDFIEKEPKELVKLMDLTVDNTIPSENDWFEFVDHPQVKQWKSVRTEALILIGAAKSAKKLQSGQLSSAAEINAAKFLQDASERYNKVKNQVFNIRVPFPSLLGKSPNGSEEDD